MVKLLVYAYCTGTPSSCQIERAIYYEQAPCRVLADNQTQITTAWRPSGSGTWPPWRGSSSMSCKFCQRAGLVTLGHVAVDGTKVQASASKHKAMSYGRMGEAERRLEAKV